MASPKTQQNQQANNKNINAPPHKPPRPNRNNKNRPNKSPRRKNNRPNRPNPQKRLKKHKPKRNMPTTGNSRRSRGYRKLKQKFQLTNRQNASKTNRRKLHN
jgi:hypothetical protein